METREIFGADRHAVASFWGIVAAFLVLLTFLLLSMPIHRFFTRLGLPPGYSAMVVGMVLGFGTWWAVKRWVGGKGRQDTPT